LETQPNDDTDVIHQARVIGRFPGRQISQAKKKEPSRVDLSICLKESLANLHDRHQQFKSLNLNSNSSEKQYTTSVPERLTRERLTGRKTDSPKAQKANSPRRLTRSEGSLLYG